MSYDLKLFFPQWQGGCTQKLFNGAEHLRENYFSKIDFKDVPLSTGEQLPIEDDIIGCRILLNQLITAKNILTETKPSSIFTLGGDCAVEIAPVSYLNQLYQGNLAVIWLDAHGDLNTPASSSSKHFHGMPLRLLLGDGHPRFLEECFSTLKPEQVVMAGIRDLDLPEQEFITTQNIQCLGVPELTDGGANLVQYLHAKKVQNIYVHLDLDVLDPDSLPCALFKTPNGLEMTALLETLENLKTEFNMVGMSLLEYVSLEKEQLADFEKLTDWVLG